MFDIDTILGRCNGIVGDYRLRVTAEQRRDELQRLYPELHLAVLMEPWGYVVHAVRPETALYTTIKDGKILDTALTLYDACRLAQQSSLVDRGVTYRGRRGSCVSVWSGECSPYLAGSAAVRGVTKHVTYCCGVVWR